MRWLMLLTLAGSLAVGAALTGSRATRAATNQLLVQAACSYMNGVGKSNAAFSWSGNTAAALQQWLDISTLDNGWQAGTFVSAGPFTSAVTSYTWQDLKQSTPHYARVNEQLPDGSWQSSPTYPFVSAYCNPPTPTPGQPAASSAAGVNSVYGFVVGSQQRGAPRASGAPGDTLHFCGPQALVAQVKLQDVGAIDDLSATVWSLDGQPFPGQTYTPNSTSPDLAALLTKLGLPSAEAQVLAAKLAQINVNVSVALALDGTPVPPGSHQVSVKIGPGAEIPEIDASFTLSC